MMNSKSRRLVLVLSAGSALSLSSLCAAAEAGAIAGLHLRAAEVDTSRGVAAPALAAAIGAKPAGTRYVIQLDGPITPTRRARLVAAGITPGDYLPDYAYIVTLDRADAKAVAALDFIRWHSLYLDSWKLDPEVGARPYQSQERQALRKQGRDLYTVTIFSGVDSGAVERRVWASNALVRDAEQGPAGHMELTVEAPDNGVALLAVIPGIQYIEPAPEVMPRSNYTTRWIVQNNASGTFPLYANGLHGEGQVVGILDGRVDINHCSFLDTNPVGPTHRKVLGMQSTGAGDSHGTHVAGIAVGNDPLSADTANTRGVAYLGKLSWGTYGAVTAAEFNTGINFNRSKGARIHTNSWGNDGTTSYDALCRAVDEQTYNNEDDMICFAVTNLSTLKNPENAKNVLAVGNVQDAPSVTTICTGGAGPTSDGRQKPEIWAPGCATLSSQSGTACGTVSLTGTSMASPAIAGTAMLVRQYYTDGYYPLGIAGGSGFTPSGALIRATLMNTGQDLTAAASGFQVPTGYPSVQEGWGRVKADDALYFPGDARKLLISDVRNANGLVTSGENLINVNVLGSGQQLRVTLTWTEPPATAGAAQAAINDLDLIVEGPGGVYLGNVFNTTTGVSTTGGTRDSKNNTEQVHISTPTPGPYTVRVRGANVAQGTQGYAVVVTGDIVGGTPPPLAISLPNGSPSLIPPGTPTDITVRVTPGSQTVVPGSPAMLYRLSASGSYITSPLIPLTGNDYRATLPGALCGNTPQFYFTAQGSGGATVLTPSSAPTNVYSTAVGTVTTGTILSVDFSGVFPAGWTATGLWHMSSLCPPTGTPCAGTSWAYYGQDGNCTFNTGAANTGTLTAPVMALPTVPAGGSISLSFCSALITENSPSWDKAEVLVNGAPVSRIPDSADWGTQTVDLTAFAGQNVTLAFRFDTVDQTLNDFRGWHIDNVRITATSTTCTNPASCYANCDNSTAAPVLNALDFSCFLTRFAANDSYANCDNSTTSPVLNALDFSCFLTQFAAGCT